MDPDPSTLPDPPTQPSKTRRVPPPCWTHDETLALIEAYHDKWYSLRRGNLKALHWQEVADSVTRRCHLIVPSKTSVQCRHKIEKLRKRYRTEKQRTLSFPNRYSSSWVFYKKMDSMEKGPSSAIDDNAAEDDEEDEDDDDDPDVNQNEYSGEKGIDEYNFSASNSRNFYRPMSNGGATSGSGGGGGFRFRIPGGQQQQQRSIPDFTFPKPKNYGRFDEIPNPNFEGSPNSRYMSNGGGSGGSWSKSDSGRNNSGNKGKREMGHNPISEMVSSIKSLGEGFLKMEQMKIDMAMEVEKMRMEMELRRTEMILDSQQKIVDAFAEGFSSNKKVKMNPSPPRDS